MNARTRTTARIGAVLAVLIGLTAVPAVASAAPTVELTPANKAFGQQVVGTESAPFNFTLTNTNPSDGPVTVISVGKGGNNPGQFKIKAGGTCDAALVLDSENPSCTVRVTFDPGLNATGGRNSLISVVTDLSPTPLTSTIRGTGIPVPVPTAGVSAAAIQFGDRLVGDGPTIPQTVFLSAQGGAPLSVGAVSLAGADASQFQTNVAVCQNRTLAAGESCQFTVTFDPDSAGLKKAQISFVTNAAAGSPTNIFLAGTGKVPPPTPSAGLAIGRKLPLVRNKRVRLPVSCVLVSARNCSGSVQLTARGRALGKKGKAAREVFGIGRAAYTVRNKGTIVIRLKNPAVKALKKRGRLQIGIRLVVRQPDGTARARTTVRTVKAPKKAKRR